MPVIVNRGGRDFIPAPEGLHIAVCVDVVELGELDSPWGKKRKVELRWQIAERTEEGAPFLVRQRYGASLHERATLRQHLDSWRGKAFTKTELDGFDLETLIGVSGQILVEHRTTDRGVFANVTKILKLAKGMKPLVSEQYIRVKDRPRDGAVAAEAAGKDDDDEVPF